MKSTSVASSYTTKRGPVIRRQDHYCNPAVREILLILSVLIASYKNLKAGLFGGIQQHAILKTLPTQFTSPGYVMSSEKPRERSGSIRVE